MTIYAMLHRPIGRILGWAIPEHIAETSPLVQAAWLQVDLRAYGTAITKDGKRVPPTEFFLSPADLNYCPRSTP